MDKYVWIAVIFLSCQCSFNIVAIVTGIPISLPTNQGLHQLAPE
jgi:hypothetical protein